MNILFISSANIIAGNLTWLLKKENHNVKLFIDDKNRKSDFDNMVQKTNDWRKELNWVGKDGLIVFDDIGYGEIQDNLRKQGYSVFGGCELGDKLELDRQYAQNIFQNYGIKTPETKNFKNISSCIRFIKRNKGPWVIKQNDHALKHLNYVPVFSDSRDSINILENYKKYFERELRTITIQKKVEGVEIGVGRFFNGKDWIGPIEINIEHKKFFPGDLGPSTSEMGTLAWYDDKENNKLFRETLKKLKPYLQKIKFKGDIELNCIVNKNGAFPLEATPRLGSPIIYLQCEIHDSPWGEFLKAVADGKLYKLKWKRGYGIVVLIAVPPFPYVYKLKETCFRGVNIYFDRYINKEKFKHIHFEGAALQKILGKD